MFASLLPPWLTLVGFVGFIIWFFRQDAREPAVGSRALWISGIWLFLQDSRSLGSWIACLSEGNYDIHAGASKLGGNIPDQIAITFLVISSLFTLNRRHFDWGTFFRSNLSVWAIYLYFLGSALWADEPFVVFKRISRDFSLVFLVLVIATEPNWSYAIRKLFLRVGYVIFPLSVVLIKFFPSIGRVTSSGGDIMYGGVTLHKNSLGEVIIVFGMIFIWDLAVHLGQDQLPFRDPRVLRRLLLIGSCAYLLLIIGCSTAIVCLALGSSLYWLTGKLLRARSPKTALFLCLMAATALYSADAIFQIKEYVVQSVGRNMTLTGRTEIWDVLLHQPINRWIGHGYYMFWDSAAGQTARKEIGMAIGTAHNGFIEMYLDGGLIGITLLVSMLFARGLAIFNRFADNQLFTRMGLIFFCIVVCYNLSESSFLRTDVLWLMLLMAMLSVPRTDASDGDVPLASSFPPENG